MQFLTTEREEYGQIGRLFKVGKGVGKGVRNHFRAVRNAQTVPDTNRT